MLFSFVILFWPVIAVLLSYMAFRSRPVWMGLHFDASSEVKANSKWNSFERLYTVFKQIAKCVSSLFLAPLGNPVAAMWLSCFLCWLWLRVICFSICSPLTWVVSSPLIKCTDCCKHTDYLPCPQPDTNWQQPTNGGRTRAADLHFKEAEQRSPARWHG